MVIEGKIFYYKNIIDNVKIFGGNKFLDKLFFILFGICLIVYVFFYIICLCLKFSDVLSNG